MISKHFILTAVLLAAGCAAWRLWSDSPVSTPPSAAPAQVQIPASPDERRKAALFYSDLGLNTVDVSAYPAARKNDYVVYTRVCSRCHSLARSINAPYVNQAWWEFYIARMRVRAHFHGDPLTKEEIQSVLDFLEYDSNERKVAHAAQFEATKAELKRRFEALLDERIQQLQNQPEPRLVH